MNSKSRGLSIIEIKDIWMGCVDAELGPAHQSARTRSEQWHDAALMLKPVGYTGQTGCRREDRRRD